MDTEERYQNAIKYATNNKDIKLFKFFTAIKIKDPSIGITVLLVCLNTSNTNRKIIIYEVASFVSSSQPAANLGYLHYEIKHAAVEIEILNVLPRVRCWGFARTLLQEMEELHSEMDITGTIVSQRSESHPEEPDEDTLIEIYEKLGYEPCKRRPRPSISKSRNRGLSVSDLNKRT